MFPAECSHVFRPYHTAIVTHRDEPCIVSLHRRISNHLSAKKAQQTPVNTIRFPPNWKSPFPTLQKHRDFDVTQHSTSQIHRSEGQTVRLKGSEQSISEILSEIKQVTQVLKRFDFRMTLIKRFCDSLIVSEEHMGGEKSA